MRVAPLIFVARRLQRPQRYHLVMTIEAILSAIDAEISKLQQARAMLADVPSAPAKKSVGRPKGTKSLVVAKSVKKRVMSEEARARIAAAQKKRWAATKKAK